MKLLSFFLPALFLHANLFAQKQPAIVFKIKDGAHKKIRYVRHVDGKNWPLLAGEDSLNANGELVLYNKETIAGVYSFPYKKGCKLFVEPGRSYTITVDPANKETPYTIDAIDKEAQLAYNKLNWDFSQTVGMRLYRQDSVFANIKQKVLNTMDSCLQPFEQLYEQHKISNTFYAHVKCTVKNYYASVLASILFMPVREMVFHKDSAGYDVAKINALEDKWRQVLAVADIMDPVAMSTNTYNDYFYFYNNFYLSYFLYQKNGNQIVKGRDNSDVPYYSVKKYITKEPLREYWMAMSLYLYVIENHYQEFIPGFYNEFVKLYPRSKYTKYLTAGVEEVKRFHNTGKNEFTAEHHFVQQADSISSVEDLLTRFKGKTIYIDMWATWCGPCKSQFAYKNELDPFLKSKGVEVLYVSLDRPSEEDQWKTMIKFYNLEGHHIRASEKLTSDIYKVFSNGRGISIPRYVICKDGKIIIDNAKQPGDKVELYKQIESVL